MFDAEFCNSLPHDPLDAVEAMAAEFLQRTKDDRDLAGKMPDSIRAMVAVQRFAAMHNLEGVAPAKAPELTDNPEGNVAAIRNWFIALEKGTKIAQNNRIASESIAFYDGVFKNGHVVELSNDEYNHVQHLIDQIRKFLSESVAIEKDHRERLLHKLEKLQAEMHKRMSNVDKVWAFFGDAGIAFGKFGEDAKPLFDRASELLGVIFQAQGRAAQLPGPTDLPKLLGYKNESEYPRRREPNETPLLTSRLALADGVPNCGGCD